MKMQKRKEHMGLNGMRLNLSFEEEGREIKRKQMAGVLKKEGSIRAEIQWYKSVDTA